MEPRGVGSWVLIRFQHCSFDATCYVLFFYILGDFQILDIKYWYFDLSVWCFQHIMRFCGTHLVLPNMAKTLKMGHYGNVGLTRGKKNHKMHLKRWILVLAAFFICRWNGLPSLVSVPVGPHPLEGWLQEDATASRWAPGMKLAILVKGSVEKNWIFQLKGLSEVNTTGNISGLKIGILVLRVKGLHCKFGPSQYQI